MQLRFNAAILSIAFASLLSASGRAATGSEASSRGYVLPDGSIQVVAYGDMVGITERIASLLLSSASRDEVCNPGSEQFGRLAMSCL